MSRAWFSNRPCSKLLLRLSPTRGAKELCGLLQSQAGGQGSRVVDRVGRQEACRLEIVNEQSHIAEAHDLLHLNDDL